MSKIRLIPVRARPIITGFCALWAICWAVCFLPAQIDQPGKDNERGATLGVLGLRCAPRLLAVAPGATQTLTVQVDSAPEADLTINLVSNNPSLVGVPDAVTILAGQTSAPVTIMGVARGNTFITASTDVEQATCNVSVAPRLTGDVVRVPAASVRVIVGPLPAPTLGPAVRVLVGPVPFAITQPVRTEVRNP